MHNLLKKKYIYFNKLKPKIFKITYDKKDNFIYYPPVNNEWCNSIYKYNKAIYTSLPMTDIVVNKLIKSYFFLELSIRKKIKSLKKIKYFKKDFILKRKSTNRVFVSKAEFKHTNDKIIITLFTYNRYKKFLLKKIKKIYKNLKKNRKRKNKLEIIIYWTKYFYFPKIKNIKYKPIKIYKLHRKVIKYYNIYLKKILKMEKLLLYYNKLYILNNYKFKHFFLYSLKILISKIYKKKIEFRIVNLKNLKLNSDIFLESIAIKLKNRKNRLLKVFKKVLRLVKLPAHNRYHKSIYDKYHNYEIKLNNLYLKKYKTVNIKSLYNLEKKKDILHKYIYIMYSDIENFNKPINNIKKKVLYYIKNKYIKGIKIEGKGRLTKRLTASRSIFKYKYKGSINNLNTTIDGVSSVMLKGYAKSNVQFTSINSKTRNGSFGLKGWVSSF